MAEITAVLWCWCWREEKDGKWEMVLRNLHAICVYVNIAGISKSGQNLLALRVLTSISHLNNPVLDPFL